MLRMLLTASAAGSAASLLLIIFKHKLLKRFGGRWYYFTCLFSLLLFLLPVKLNKSDIFPVRIINSAPRAYAVSETAGSTALSARPAENVYAPAAEYTPPEVITETQESAVPFKLDLRTSIIAVWLIGVAAVMGKYIYSYNRFIKTAVPKNIRGFGKPEIIKTNIITSPMFVGFFRPRLLIPEIQMEKGDYELALCHELVHYRRRDSWLKLFAAFVNSVHWFNPLTYAMVNVISEACEYACDEVVTDNMDGAGKKRYSEMILNIAEQSAPTVETALASGFARSKTQLLRRFELIMDKRVKSFTAKSAIAAALAAAGIAAASALVFAEGSADLFEGGGAIITPYEYPAMDMDYNISRTLRKNDRDFNHELLSDLSLYKYTDASNRTVFSWKPVGLSEVCNYTLIDENGRLIDIYNQTEPYYCVHKTWRSKNRADWGPASEAVFDEIGFKTVNAGDSDVTVGFLGSAKDYMYDDTIDKMIKNQISFELSYNSPYHDYSHNEYISNLINDGIYLIYGVDSSTDIKMKNNANPYGIWMYGPAVEESEISRLFERYTARVFYDKNTLIPKNTDGNQGMELDCDIEVNPGDFIAIETGDMPKDMPTLNFTLYSPNGLERYSQLSRDGSSVKPYEPWATVFGSIGNMRYCFLPFADDKSHTINVKVSAPENGYADIKIYTCSVPDFENGNTDMFAWCDELFGDQTVLKLTEE